MYQIYLQKMLRRVGFDEPFAVTLPAGDSISFGSGDPKFSVRFKNRRAVTELVTRSALGFGEAYVRGDVDVEGDIAALVRLGFALRENGDTGTLAARIRYALGFLARANTLTGSRRNIAAHYDLSNDFYRLWLDQEMQYTCAYFDAPDASLEAAQLRKMDLVCRKLALRPGQVVVEAGGGWGGLALHMAQRWGVQVLSFNISAEQVAYARARAASLGVGAEQVQYIQDDYRNIGRYVTQCDAFASICMLEHVGRENYESFLTLVGSVLKPKGAALLQFISRTRPAARPNPWLERHVFPGYYNPSMGELVAALELSGTRLQLTDAENMRFHYALTLQHWLSRLEAHAGEIRARWGEAVLRTFRLYLAGGLADFTRGEGTLVYQALLVNGPDNDAPLDRVARLGLGLEAPAKEIRKARLEPA